MGDQELWDLGLRSIEKMLAGLLPENSRRLSELLAGYRQEKEALAAVIRQIDSDATCRTCAGQCCLNGKYRINIFDLLSQSAANRLISPDFEQKPLCPYGTTGGCLMEPGFRPADCILFICDALDGRLSNSAKAELGTREKTLRDFLSQASLLSGVPLATPLLLWAEKNILQTNP